MPKDTQGISGKEGNLAPSLSSRQIVFTTKLSFLTANEKRNSWHPGLTEVISAPWRPYLGLTKQQGTKLM